MSSFWLKGDYDWGIRIIPIIFCFRPVREDLSAAEEPEDCQEEGICIAPTIVPNFVYVARTFLVELHLDDVLEVLQVVGPK